MSSRAARDARALDLRRDYVAAGRAYSTLLTRYMLAGAGELLAKLEQQLDTAHETWVAARNAMLRIYDDE